MLHHSVGAPDSAQFHRVDQFVSASYLISLFYWIFSFAQEVPERREFTPQMQNFLLALAGNARSTRMAMSDSASKSDLQAAALAAEATRRRFWSKTNILKPLDLRWRGGIPALESVIYSCLRLL